MSRLLFLLFITAAVAAVPAPAYAGGYVSVTAGITIPGGMVVIGQQGWRTMYGRPGGGGLAYGYVEGGRWYNFQRPYQVQAAYWSASYRGGGGHHGSFRHPRPRSYRPGGHGSHGGDCNHGGHRRPTGHHIRAHRR